MHPVVLLSGGLDSAVLLSTQAATRPFCLIFDYGQRHKRELWFARQIAHYYGAEYRILTLPTEVFAGCALTGSGEIPRGHYADPIQQVTVVQNRNMVLLSIVASFAARLGRTKVMFGAHAGDAAIYPDCRPEFVGAVNAAMELACGVTVSAPFLGMTKKEIVALGRSHTVPLDMTWSCYEGGNIPCGACGACVERAEALA